MGANDETAAAAATGVATPSLCKHIDSLDALRRLIAVRSMNDLADRLVAAVLGRSRDDALRALMIAYRAYALDHPNRYAALPQHPVPDPDLSAAGTRTVEVSMLTARPAGAAGQGKGPGARPRPGIISRPDGAEDGPVRGRVRHPDQRPEAHPSRRKPEQQARSQERSRTATKNGTGPQPFRLKAAGIAVGGAFRIPAAGGAEVIVNHSYASTRYW